MLALGQIAVVPGTICTSQSATKIDLEHMRMVVLLSMLLSMHTRKPLSGWRRHAWRRTSATPPLQRCWTPTTR